MLEDQQDHTECGFRCEFSGDTCNFFTVSSGNCHLGRYNYWDQGTVEDTSTPMTYHRSGNFQNIQVNKWILISYRLKF